MFRFIADIRIRPRSGYGAERQYRTAATARTELEARRKMLEMAYRTGHIVSLIENVTIKREV